MSKNNPKTAAISEAGEPTALKDPVPMWLLLLMAALVYWGLVYISNRGGGFDRQVYVPYESYADVDAHNPKDKSQEFVLMGQDIFNKTCAACHQPTGSGKDGTAPPLAGSEWVQAPGPNRIAHAVLNGLTGPITVKGTEWNLTMPPWKDVYNDEQIAAVLTFIRRSWDNKAGAVKPEEVAAARKDVHPGPETGSELLQMQP